MTKVSILKGFSDVFPPEINIWQRIEEVARANFKLYGYEELRLPIVEPTELFIRGIGEDTDIVQKEMYTFTDRGGRSLTLRPEGTASAVRCYIENQLYSLPSPQKFYYQGPMFRYERPQRGRQRQFYQIGCEAFGVSSPYLDAELILMIDRILKELGLRDLTIEINSIGCGQCRPDYKKELLAFFANRLSQLCSDCNRRYSTNPLRILDCKVPSCIEARLDVPVIKDFLCDECAQHLETLKGLLGGFQLSIRQNHQLVRGLDYYTKTIFEVTTDDLGAQKAVAAGGRYDNLIEQFGGPPTPAVGFAMGVERLVELMKQTFVEADRKDMVFIATLGVEAEKASYAIAEELRSKGIAVLHSYGQASLKNQLRKADRMKASHVLIIGEDELASGQFSWKDLRDGTQGKSALGDFINTVRGRP